MSDKKIYKNANETLKIFNEIINYNNNAQKFFHRASKVDKKIRTKDLRKYCRENKIKKTKIGYNQQKERKHKQ